MLGSRIRTLREARGLTQEGLAREVHVTKGTVYRWERGDWQPRAKTWPALASSLGVSLDSLIGRQEKQ